MTLTWVSYALACAVCLFLAVRFAATRVNGRIARRVSAAAGITAIWAFAAADSGASRVPPWLMDALELARYVSWFHAASGISRLPRVPWLTRTAFSIWGVLFVALLCAPYLPSLPGWLASTGGLHNLSALLMALVGMVWTEQLLRNTSADNRTAMRLAAIAIGGQYAYDLFMYAQGQLVGQIDPIIWLGRGIVTASLTPLMAFAMHRLGSERVALFISRHVLFYTGTLVAVGCYLCLMAVGGYYVRVRGGGWGEQLQLLFLFGAALALASILATESLWRRLRVFIATHFYHSKYDYRVEWLRFVKTLSTSSADADTRRTAIEAVAQIFGIRHGAIYLLDETDRFFTQAASYANEPVSLPLAPQFDCDPQLLQLLQGRHWLVDLRELRDHPAAYGHIALPQWLVSERRWRLLVPLLNADRLVAVLLLGEPPAPYEMDFEDRDLLKTVGRHVAVHMSQHEADRALTEARQFDAYNRFAAFVMHDLKNAVAQLQLLVDNASRHRRNPQFVDDAISTIANTVSRMTRLIEQLQSRDLQGQRREIDLAPLLRNSVARCRSRQPEPRLEWSGDELRVQGDPEKLSAVIEHVIRNAQEATGEQGEVTVRLQSHAGGAAIQVVDNGAGMEPQFVRERLFKPFDSTKGTQGMGIGAYQARNYVRHLGGDVEVQSSPGQGTRFTITLPLCPTINPAY